MFSQLLLSCALASLEVEETLDYAPAWDVPVTVAAATVGVSLVVFHPQLASSTCRWCESELNGFDTFFRNSLKWNDTRPARRAGDAIGYGAVPLAGAAMHLLPGLLGAGWARSRDDFLIAGEAVAVAHALEQVIKLGAARARPVLQFNPREYALATEDPSDLHASFVSGHASVGFSIAFANGTIATMRGYAWAPAVWAAGLALATVSSYLRIAADRHYMTDVLGGAVLGACVGTLVPLLHRKMPVLGGVRLTFSPQISQGSYGLGAQGEW